MVLVEGDLSQAEARVTAALAGDRKTLELFNSGQDIHKLTASKIFKVDPDDVTVEQRHLGKMARHALNYGMGWKEFMSSVNKDADLTGVAIDAKTAKQIVDQYHRDNPKLVRWWREVEFQVREKGYLTNIYGRKRIFIDQSNPKAMIAYLPQSIIADHLNSLLITAFNTLDGPEFQVLLQIHDAILGQSPIQHHLTVARKLRKLMTKSVVINRIEVQIPADVSLSRNSWGEMKEVRV